MRKIKVSLILLANLLSASAFANTITEARVEPSEVKAGESFKVILKVSSSEGTNKITKMSGSHSFTWEKNSQIMLELKMCDQVAPEEFECKVQVHPRAPSGKYTYAGGFYGYTSSGTHPIFSIDPLQVTITRTDGDKNALTKAPEITSVTLNKEVAEPGEELNLLVNFSEGCHPTHFASFFHLEGQSEPLAVGVSGPHAILRLPEMRAVSVGESAVGEHDYTFYTVKLEKDQKPGMYKMRDGASGVWVKNGLGITTIARMKTSLNFTVKEGPCVSDRLSVDKGPSAANQTEAGVTSGSANSAR